MTDLRIDDPKHVTDAAPLTRAERDSAWERALSGPPINPRSELIYHDRKKLQSRHA